MPTSLYQKYRPQLFADMVGQDHIRTTLLNELKRSSVAHAYLFAGPRGIGKTTSARLLARAVNCRTPKDTGEPCNQCDVCTMIMNGRALDIIEIDAASNTGVDHVRENIIENARVAPSLLPWKVFIIDEVHMLSTSAFNALLKTLEEPPKNVLFILATTELHKVPATIVSRCERFTFRKVSFTDMVERIRALAKREGVEVDEVVLRAIAKRSEGALRDAESLLGQVLTLGDGKITQEMAELVLPHSDTGELLGLFQDIVQRDTAAGLQRVERLYSEGAHLADFLKQFIEFSRGGLLYAVQGNAEALEYCDVAPEEVEQLNSVLKNTSPLHLARIVEALLRAQEQAKSAVIPQLPLELAIVRLTTEVQQHTTPAVKKTAHTASSKPVPAPDSAPTTPFPQAPQPSQVAPESASAEAASETTPQQPPVPAGPLTLDSVQQQWNAVLQAMKHANHALHLTFQVGVLVGVEENAITLGFQYQFYQDRLNDARNIPVIEKALHSVFGQRVIVRSVVGKEYVKAQKTELENIEEPSTEEVANIWDLAAASFSPQQTNAQSNAE